MTDSASPRGKFIIVIGPTGSGKSVLISYVKDQFASELVFPASCTTRERRPGHENDSYRFLSVEEFERMRDDGEFLEWAQYGHNYYGTLKEEIENSLAKGKVLLKEMEVQGVRQVQDILPKSELVLIYIDAGSWEDLERRVRARAPITDEELEKRRKRFEDEVPFKDVADFVIENKDGGLEDAKAALKQAIESVLASVRA